MELIRINFLAEEVMKRRNDQLRRTAILAYTGIWLVSLSIILAIAAIKQSEADQRQREFVAVRTQIKQEAPQFVNAIQAYNRQRLLAAKLDASHENCVELGFVVQCLRTIAGTIPENFWLEEISFLPMESKVFEDKRVTQAPYIKGLTLQGKLYFDLHGENEPQVRRFEEGLSDRVPFSTAMSQIDLSHIEVGRYGGNRNYYHSFSLYYAWPGPLY